MKWVPNAVTAARVLLIPVVVALMEAAATEPGAWSRDRIWAIAVYLVVAASDWLDGYLARRLDAISRWGSSADALGDRLALLLPLVYLAVRQPAHFTGVPLWIPAWLVVLDVATGAAWALARWRRGARPPRAHHQVGRTGAWILFVLVLYTLLGLPDWGALLLAVTGLAMATASALRYVRTWLGD